LSKGAFYRPTLLEVTDPKLPIVQQEVFGPNATFQVFDTEVEAVCLANESEYELAASIWTLNSNKPWRVAKALQAGTIWINTYAQIFPQFEEGGYKQNVFVYADWSGSFKGDFMGLKTPGKSFKFKDVDIFKFDDEGKITEHRAVLFSTFLKQIASEQP